MNPDTFEPLLIVRHTDPRDLFWVDSQTLLVVGGRRSELVSLVEEKSSLIALSSYEKAFFDSENRVNVISDGQNYLMDIDIGEWDEAETSALAFTDRRVLESPAHRVYTESSETAYANLVKVRTVDGFGNRVLFPGPVVDRADMSEDGDSARQSVSAPGVFEHGLRSSGRSVSLVFNAIDGDEGLGEVLNVLADYGIRSTFFVSGDFLRRHPDSAKALASSGHEIGSLFYTHMDMTDFRYRIDSDFIIRGLGRNEDEFFHATGHEVSTLWHAPWYVVSPPIMEATRRMSYAYIGRDVDPMDWVALDGDRDTYRLYKKSAELVEDVLSDKAPGSIIPIRIGKPGKRDDYFFRELDLLINGLLKDGYDVVSISELMEESR